MKKLTKSNKSFSLLLGLSLLTAVPSWSQDAKLEIEQKPLFTGPSYKRDGGRAGFIVYSTN